MLQCGMGKRKRVIMKKAGLALLLSVLGACTTASLEELRSAKLDENPFRAALAKEYLGFAEEEAREYDWIDSKYFADKGLLVAYGNDVAPEDPANWNIDAGKRDELLASREKLIAALTPQNLATKPDVAARAQYGYDCWVEQQEEAWQSEDIEACKNIFQSSLEELGGATIAPAGAVETGPDNAAYVVFFDFDSTLITPEAQQVISQILADHAKYPDALYTLNGHTDRSGTEEYNMKLAERRALAVRGMLIKGGVKPENIDHFAFGETDPDLQTDDGIKEPANRRVEIFID
jgi:OmpA-OmpF porin, OOP family